MFQSLRITTISLETRHLFAYQMNTLFRNNRELKHDNDGNKNLTNRYIFKNEKQHFCTCIFQFWYISQLLSSFWRPDQTLATFQRNILQHCCMMLRQLLNGLAKRTQHSSRHLFTSFFVKQPLRNTVFILFPFMLQFITTCRCLWAPGLWRTRTLRVAIASGPSAHALAQQCCVNVAKRLQHHATSKMLHEKFDRFQIWSNMLQHIATYRNRVAKRTQHVPNNVARCCVEMLRAFGQALTTQWNDVPLPLCGRRDSLDHKFSILSSFLWSADFNFTQGARFSKARNAICKTPIHLFCKAGLLRCCKGLSLKVGRGRGDVGTWGRGDVGTPGRGDSGTRGLRNSETRGDSRTW